ncbi:tyrosine-type recombinase/integrase [Pseudomonas syringae group genomosp. 3]|uniref:Site-specific recombinase, phage integrase family n=2 Tax=Pseudomonas syringae group genomosp. 3 TaxID=251701 RepID=Q87XW7_PSESM|nr:tyrosine-type recombinase/integrase [Pseudomonas syringae group genomosp. 3]AAO57514.1 site-specific recombinase, phage integrase family [Pseudomonas syringae pv. tomato str. DC3000]KPY89593.1 Site-specific recombinase, phage integrase family [Pseudomonas syringae pv. tomato]
MRPRKKDRHLPPCMYLKHGAYYLVRKGKWERLGSDFQEALLAYAKIVGGKSNGGMSLLIDEALDAMRRRLSENTIKQYEAASVRLKTYLEEFEPRQVLPRHVAALKLHMADTPNMANRVISFLRMVFAYALERQIVDSNPCTGIRRHAEKKRDRYISDAEFAAICAASSEYMSVIWEMCFLTGQRISDVLNIKLSDISDVGIAFEQQKTGAKLIVAMSPDLKALLDRVHALPRKVRGATLFCARSGGKPVSYDTCKMGFRAACKAAGVKGATIHDLRAKSLTDTDRQGNNAQMLGGHTDAKMTKRYLRLREIDIAQPPTMPKKSL